ncbi:MAG: hypothetical protein ACSHX4_04035 [Opitutaceae bacterium]
MSEGKQTELTREQLFELVWSKPATQLVSQLGISDVAITKACRRFNIPKPPRGYWNKRNAGHKIRKPRLTKAPEGVPEQIKFRIGDYSMDVDLPRIATFPESVDELNKIAGELKVKIETGDDDETGMVKVSEREYPYIHVSKKVAWKTCQCVHTLIEFLESIGIDKGYIKDGKQLVFHKEGEIVELSVYENTETIELPLTAKQKKAKFPFERIPQTKEQPTGMLGFSISIPKGWVAGQAYWNESDRLKLPGIIPRIARRIDKVLKVRRDETLDREQRRQEYLAQQRIDDHPKIIDAHKKQVVSNLESATYWWTRSRELKEYVKTCQSDWEANQVDGLTSDQETWIEWALKHAERMSPRASGYPNPSTDGPFDYEAIPIGGPYPEVTTVPELPEIKFNIKNSGYNQQQAEFRYPFWLKHQ